LVGGDDGAVEVQAETALGFVAFLGVPRGEEDVEGGGGGSGQEEFVDEAAADGEAEAAVVLEV
jgi:hypothetical protein